MKSVCGLLLICAAAGGLPAIAGESEGPATIDKVKLGDHWFGPKLDVEDLKGRVVFIEFWGLK